jgi:hypothetical protein
MKFEEVLPLLRDGKKARCPDWIEGSYVILRNREFIYVLSNGEEEFTHLGNIDIIDGNWEIVE